MRRTKVIAGAMKGARSFVQKQAGRAEIDARRAKQAQRVNAITRGDGTRVRTRYMHNSGTTDLVKTRVRRPVVPEVTAGMVLSAFKVYPFAQYTDQVNYPTRAIVASSLDPSGAGVPDVYKVAEACKDGFYGYWDTPDEGGLGDVCSTVHPGPDWMAMTGPEWWTAEDAVWGDPGVPQDASNRRVFPLAAFSHELLNSQYSVTERPDVAAPHPFVKGGQFVSHYVWLVEFRATYNGESKIFVAALHVIYTYSNPYESFYADPLPSEHEVVTDNAQVNYNYLNTTEELIVFGTRTYSGLGTTNLLPNSGVGFAGSWEKAADGSPDRSLRIFTYDDLGDLQIDADGMNGIFTLGGRRHQMDFAGFRYLSNEAWDAWGDAAFGYENPRLWFAKSGYPIDYDLSFHDPVVTRAKVWSWARIEGSASVPTNGYHNPMNIWDVRARITTL